MPFAKDQDGKEKMVKVCICCSFILKEICSCLAKNFGVNLNSGTHAENLALYIQLFGKPDCLWLKWTKKELECQKLSFTEKHALLKEPATHDKSTPKTPPHAVSNRSTTKRKICAKNTVDEAEKTLEEWHELFKEGGGLIT